MDNSCKRCDKAGDKGNIYVTCFERKKYVWEGEAVFCKMYEEDGIDRLREYHGKRD